MKKIVTLLVFSLLFTSLQSFSQVGIGIGSRGMNVRTNPDARKGLIIRSGFSFSILPWSYHFEPEAAFIRRHHYSEHTQLYYGLGVAADYHFDNDEYTFGYGAFIPVGLEFFPFDHNPRISFSLETGLRLMTFGNYDDKRFDPYSLLEITFYLDDRGDDYYKGL
jgi:hypothetical protein